MLSAGKLGRGQERYYLDKVAEGAEDYYSGEGEGPGQWLGDGAEDLGLNGQVEPDQLVAMLTGRHPATGEPLGLRHVDGGAVPGFDLTFSAPKSVSLSWALGGPPVGAVVQGNGFLAAAYTHRSSRAGDPQLHTHALVANATKGPDGRWTRLYHPGIYEQLKTAGYVYEAHLRSELTRRLGVQWGEVRNGIAEIEGFDPEHLKAFSTRRAEILEAAGGEGASPARCQGMCRGSGVDRAATLTARSLAIQMVMGHTKIQTTFDVYGHLLPGSYDDVRARMDAYLAAGGNEATTGETQPADSESRAKN
jgi:hypothetical protein